VTETDGGLQYRFGTHQPLTLTAALPGAHNRSNIGAALTAVHALIGDRPLADEVITDVLSAIRIPGRFDRRIDEVTGRMLILDGAHTPESIRMLVETVRAVIGPEPVPVIMGLLVDKPAEDILAVLAPAASQIVFPELSGPRIVPAESLRALARRAGIAASVRPTIRTALDAIGPGPEPVLITGSFGMVAATLTELSSAP
jgi:dihydrofolate synthase/folylpolyglutamate synthase